MAEALNPCYAPRMSKTLNISDELAAALEVRRAQAGLASIDVAAELLLADSIAMDASNADDLGLPESTLRALIAEGEASGPSASWESKSAREEIRRRFAAQKSA